MLVAELLGDRSQRVCVACGLLLLFFHAPAPGIDAAVNKGQCATCPLAGACKVEPRVSIAVHHRMPGVLVAQIHDELLAQVPEYKAEEAVVVLKEAMVEKGSDGRGIYRDVPRGADA